MALPAEPLTGFRAYLQELYDAASHNRPDEVVEVLRNLVPEYRPSAVPQPAAAVAASVPYPDDY